MGKHRKPASRAALLRASQEEKDSGGLAAAGARMMAQGMNPEASDPLVRKIVAYKATRIFHAPISWPDVNVVAWTRLPNSTDEYAATLTGRLKEYLEKGSKSEQFANSPRLQETIEKLEKGSRNNSSYLVVEEEGPISGCKMDQGECWPGLDSGAEEVMIFKIVGGAWPEFNEKTDRDNVLLAAMRTITRKEHPFELHARTVSYVTDHGESAHAIETETKIAYGGPRVISAIPDAKVMHWASALEDRADRLRKVSADPAVRELLNAIRLDKARDDEYFRLWYLRLWQALRDTGEFCKSQTLKSHIESLQPQQRWKDLTDHRNAIAHWETAKVDYKKVIDLHRLAMEVADYIATITQS